MACEYDADTLSLFLDAERAKSARLLRINQTLMSANERLTSIIWDLREDIDELIKEKEHDKQGLTEPTKQ